jgi:copper(I)-binding protein
MRRRRMLSAACALLVVWASALRADDSQSVAVRDAWARATPPGTAVAAVYLTLVGGAQPDRLVEASTGVAAMTQIHAITETEGMARMREADAGIAVPAGKTVVLAPHGLHLMLMDLARPLVAGERFEVTLEFQGAGRRVVSVAVVAPDQPTPTGH